VARLETIAMKSCPPFSRLDEENLMNYARAQKQVGFLGMLVISPFHDALKGATRYSDDNLPVTAVTTPINVGRYKFEVKTKPTKKRTNYGQVFDSLVDYVSEIRIDAKRKEIEDITLVEGVGYCIPVKELLGKVKSWLEVTPGVEQEIKRPEYDSPSRLVVPFRLNFGDLSEKVADVYLNTFGFVESARENVVQPFEAALKAGTGYDKNHLPKYTEPTWTDLGSNLVRVLSVPYPSPSYADVVKQIVGDLQAIEKGEHVVGYKVQEMKGKRFVAMKATVDRLNDLLKDNTKPALRQEISYIPNVEITM